MATNQPLDMAITDAIKTIMQSTDRTVSYDVRHHKDDTLWPSKKKKPAKSRTIVTITIEDGDGAPVVVHRPAARKR